MLHLVLFIIAIGLVLFLWERFAAFKWVLAAIIGIPVIAIVIGLIFKTIDKQSKNKNNEIEITSTEVTNKNEKHDLLENIMPAGSQILSDYERGKIREIKIQLISEDEKSKFEKFSLICKKTLRKIILDKNKQNYLTKVIWYESVRAGLDPVLSLAIIDELSNFDQFHTTSSGRLGYFSVSPTLLSKVNPDKDKSLLFEPRVNLRFGLTAFRANVDASSGNIKDALINYSETGDKDLPERVRIKWGKYAADELKTL